MDGWVDIWMDGRKDEQIYRWTSGSMDTGGHLWLRALDPSHRAGLEKN